METFFQAIGYTGLGLLALTGLLAGLIATRVSGGGHLARNMIVGVIGDFDGSRSTLQCQATYTCRIDDGRVPLAVRAKERCLHFRASHFLCLQYPAYARGPDGLAR